MNFANFAVTQQLLILFLLRFLLAISVIGFVVGMTLLLKPALVHWLRVRTNRWVSTRENTKWLNVPRDTGALVRRWRKPVGVVFVLVASVSLYILITRFDMSRLPLLFNAADAWGRPFLWLLEAAYWLLIVGDLIAIVAGAWLLFSPGSFKALEAYADRWYSTRRATLFVDTMHMGMDRVVERFPRTAGVLIAGMSLGVMVNNWLLLKTLS